MYILVEDDKVYFLLKIVIHKLCIFMYLKKGLANPHT